MGQQSVYVNDFITGNDCVAEDNFPFTILLNSVACWQASLVKTHQAELKRMREDHGESMQKNKDWQKVSGQSKGHCSGQQCLF